MRYKALIIQGLGQLVFLSGNIHTKNIAVFALVAYDKYLSNNILFRERKETFFAMKIFSGQSCFKS